MEIMSHSAVFKWCGSNATRQRFVSRLNLTHLTTEQREITLPRRWGKNLLVEARRKTGRFGTETELEQFCPGYCSQSTIICSKIAELSQLNRFASVDVLTPGLLAFWGLLDNDSGISCSARSATRKTPKGRLDAALAAHRQMKPPTTSRRRKRPQIFAVAPTLKRGCL